MGTTGWIILAIVNIPVYFGLGWFFFKNWDDFGESVRYWFTPDVISLFRGECGEDWIAEMKLGLWLACCAGCVFGEGYLINNMLT